MKLRRLEVSNFRGLRSFKWDPGEGLNILIGPGDSAKTTVLDAIDFVLGPRWNPSFTDADFTDCDTTKSIEIIATVGELPKALLGDNRFQDHFRGWRTGELHDEFVDDDQIQDEPVLSIRLLVESSLEPIWTVWTERQTEPGPSIQAKDREKLGVVRVGNYVDRHMSWGRGSALAQYSDDMDDLTPVFAEVRRHTRAAFDEKDLPELKKTSDGLNVKAKEMGVRITQSLQPGLDFGALRDGATSVSLFDGSVPTRQMGLGSKRLLTIAMQLGRQSGQQLLLVDEIEAALEPYRIRHLLRSLIEVKVQAIATTHSPVVLQEAAAESIFQLNVTATGVTASPADTTLKNLLQHFPNALLSRRIVCCEGNTELNCFEALKEIWMASGNSDLNVEGVTSVDAGGCGEVGKVARAILSHNLPVAVFADDDETINLPQDAANDQRLCLVQQASGHSFEKALFASISDECIDLLLAQIADILGSEGNLRAQLSEYFSGLDGVVRASQLVNPILPTATKAQELARGAAEKKWFKKGDQAYQLIMAISPKWAEVLNTDFGKKTEILRAWCYAG